MEYASGVVMSDSKALGETQSLPYIPPRFSLSWRVDYASVIWPHLVHNVLAMLARSVAIKTMELAVGSVLARKLEPYRMWLTDLPLLRLAQIPRTVPAIGHALSHESLRREGTVSDLLAQLQR